ncbi:MAG: type II secretion system F family protein [Planctomycetales bacterium]|nr:type II secretion system F family protein [Planctomycetales bacterium]
MFDSITNLIRLIMPSGIVGNSLRSKQNSLLRMLSVSHSQRLDPKILIENLAAEYPGPYGRKLSLLQQWVAADSSMCAALTHTPGVLDEDDTLAIQCGIETNTLDETFRYLMAHCEKDDHAATSEIIRGTAGYVIGVICFAILISAFLMIFIVPTFKLMFDEFELALPLSMASLIDFSNSFLIVIPLFLMVALGLGILLLIDDFRRTVVNSPLARLLPTVARRRTTGLLRLLALPTSLGLPLGPTLTAAAQHHPDRSFRKRLLRARTDAKSDADIWIQLETQRLIDKTQGEQLRRITSPSLRAWTLNTLADRNRLIMQNKNEFIARSVQHIPIIILGMFVGWIAIAVIQTLSNLIGSLA